MDCLFCRIAAGELPCHKVAEDEHTLAFLDINPATRGHTLVIPKNHGTNVLDTAPDDLAAVARMVQKVAQQVEHALHPDGINIVQNNRPAAGQVVMHYHVHIIPRQQGDRALSGWSHIDKQSVDFPALAEQLRAAQ